MNGWRGVDVSRKAQKTQNGLGKLKLVFCGKRRRFLVLRIENPYNILRQITNLPQRIAATEACPFLRHDCQLSLRNFRILLLNQIGH